MPKRTKARPKAALKAKAKTIQQIEARLTALRIQKNALNKELKALAAEKRKLPTVGG